MSKKSFLRLYRCRGLFSFLSNLSRKPLVFLLFALHLLFFSSNVFAECLTFGPRQFTRQSGSPVIEQATFNKTNPLGGPYKMVILNGRATGEDRVIYEDQVSSAKIWLNGQQIASPSDFNQHIYLIEKNVTLQDSNLLEVELRSSPGSFITVKIIDQDQTAPAVSLSPLPACFNTPVITIAGSTDDQTASVKVNGNDAVISPAPSAPYPFSASVTLSQGQNLITATASDRCGNASSAQTSTTLDTFPPGVTITYPSWGMVTNIPDLVVEGQVDDPNALVFLNGHSCPVGNLTFQCPSVTLTEEGRVDITVNAIDPCGNSSSAMVSILYIAVDAWGWIDSEGGVVEVTSPASTVPGTKITIPPDALQTLTLITIDALSYGIPNPASGLLIVGNPLEFGPSGTTFSYPATACIPYDENLLNQVDSGESAVSFMIYDPITNFFTKFPTEHIDLANNLVCAEISHFSIAVPAILDTVPPVTILTVGQPQYRLPGTFAFIPGSLPPETDESRDVNVGFLNNDPYPDLFFANASSPNRLYINQGDGTFEEIPNLLPAEDHTGCSDSDFADLDDDGDTDIVVACGSSGIELYKNELDSLGYFVELTQALPETANGQSEFVTIGDVNNDGKPDILIARHLILNQGMGNYTDASNWLDWPDPSHYVYRGWLSDLDMDGDADLILEDSYSYTQCFTQYGCTKCYTRTVNSFYIYRNHYGEPGYNAPPYFQLEPSWAPENLIALPVRDIAFGDLNGDSCPDMVLGVAVQDYYGSYQKNRAWINDCLGNFTDQTNNYFQDPIYQDNIRVALGDVDGDGRLDIYFANIGQDYLYLNRLWLEGRFVPVTDPTEMPYNGKNSYGAILADLNNDGATDIAVANNQESNDLFLNQLAHGPFYITSETELSLSARDNSAGIEWTKYRFDSGDWITTPSDVFTIGEEGQVEVSYHSRDKLNNEEWLHTQNFSVDNSPPTITSFNIVPGFTKAAIVPYLININDGQFGSGVYGLAFVDTMGPDAPPQPPVNLFHTLEEVDQPWSYTLTSEEGLHTIYVWAEDYLGHISAAAVDTVTIDTENPIVTIGSPSPGDIVSANQVHVTGVVSDANLDLPTVVIIINGAINHLDPGSYDYLATLDPGPNQISVEAYDLAGNFASASVNITSGGQAELEPNNVTEQANDLNGYISPEGTVSVWGKISTNEDQDFYKFSVSQCKSVSLKFSQIPAGLSAWLAVYDMNGNLVASPQAAVLNIPITVALPSLGDYFVKIFTQDGSASMDYYGLDLALTVNTSTGGTTVSQPISADQVWHYCRSPYTVTSYLTVTAALTIEPGVTVKFDPSTSLEFSGQGTLSAVGTYSLPITFTANVISPSTYWWYGIRFFNSASKVSRLENVQIKYVWEGVYIQPAASGTQIKIKNSTIKYFLNKGIYAYVGNVANLELSGNTIELMGGAPRYGIYLYQSGGTLTAAVNGNTIAGSGGGAGIYVSSYYDAPAIGVTLSSNNININGSGKGISVYNAGPTIYGNAITSPESLIYFENIYFTYVGMTENHFNGLGTGSLQIPASALYEGANNTFVSVAPSVSLLGNTLASGAEYVYRWGPPNLFRKYVAWYQTTVPANQVLNILPGAVMEFGGGASLQVNGDLLAVGGEAEAERIRFEAYGSSSPGYWRGIWFGSGSGSGSSLEKVRIKNAEYGVYINGTGFSDRPIRIVDSEISLFSIDGIFARTYQNSIVLEASGNLIEGANNSSRHGICLIQWGNSNPLLATVADNTISGSDGGTGIYVWSYDADSDIGVTLSGNDINISGSGKGISVYNAGPVISGNEIESPEYPIYFENIDGNYFTYAGMTGNVVKGLGTGTLRIPASALCDGAISSASGLSSFVYLIGNTLASGPGYSYHWGPNLFLEHNVISSQVIIPIDQMLEILPGLEMSFGGSSTWLEVAGSLRGAGSSGSEIVFTKSGSYDSWGGIKFLSTSVDWGQETSNGSFLDYCLVKYGSPDIYIENSSPRIGNSHIMEAISSSGIDIWAWSSNEASPRIEWNTIERNSNHGINLYALSGVITAQIWDNQIRNNSYNGIASDAYPSYGVVAASIKRNTVQNNGSYELFNSNSSCLSVVSENNISDPEYSIYFNSFGSYAYTGVYNNIFNGLGTGSVRVPASTVYSDSPNQYLNMPSLELLANNLAAEKSYLWGGTRSIPYRLLGSNDLVIPSAQTLTLLPGAVIKMGSQRHIVVDGTLVSGIDPAGHGGPVLITADSSSPVPGYWGRIQFDPTSQDWNGSNGSSIENTRIEFGGYDGKGSVYIKDSKPRLSQNEIFDSSSAGIYIDGTSETIGPLVEKTKISGNQGYGVYNSGLGLPVLSPDNSILENQGAYDVYNDSPNNINACHNWWGTAVTSSIDARIYDKNDDPAKGLVDYCKNDGPGVGYLDAPPVYVDLIPPPFPQSLTAHVSGSGLILNWSPVSAPDLAGYRVYYGYAAGSYSTQGMVDVGNVIHYILSGLTPCTAYYLVVTAYDNSNNESVPSPEIRAVTALEGQPSAPQTISIYNYGTRVIVSWGKPAECDILDYNVYRREASETQYSEAFTRVVSRYYLDTALTVGKGYYYAVKSVDWEGLESGYSSEIGVANVIDYCPGP